MHELQKLDDELKALEDQPKPEDVDAPETKEEESKEESKDLPVQDLEADDVDELDTEEVAVKDEPPHAEFIRNRQESKKKRLEEAEAKNRELELELARMQAKKEAEAEFAKKNEKPMEDADPEPEPDTWEHSEWTQRQLKREIAALKEEQEQTRMRIEAANAEQQWHRIDKQWSEKNPNYKNATEYLRNRLRENVKAQFPHFDDAQVEENAKMREYSFVGGLARNKVDIETYLIAEAMKEGWTPSNTQTKPSLQRGDKPSTDKREVAYQKRQSGSVIAAPAGKGSRGITVGDVKRMGRQELLAMTAEDWKEQIEQAYNSDMR